MRSRKLLRLSLAAHKVRCQSSPAVANASNVFSIRSSGYGPSGDVLKGVPPNSHLSLTTKAALTDEDATIQKEVLTLAMPSLSGVTVQSRPTHTAYTPTTLPLKTGSSMTPSHVSATIAAELDLRMQMLELNVQQQLATVANLVVSRVAAETDHRLSSLEASQSEQAQTLAQLIMNCIQAELRATGGAGHADLAEQVANRVAHVLQAVERAPSTLEAGTVAPTLDSRIEEYFTKLEANMKKAIDSNSGNLSVAASKQILKAMDQAFRVQEESIRHVIKTVEPSGGDAHRDLEEFIEGSLRTAADNIRLHITAELKKYSKTSGRGAASRDVDSPTAQLDEQLQKLIDGASEMAASVARVDEVASDIFKEQAELKELLKGLAGGVPHAPQTDAMSQQSANAAGAEETRQLSASVAELKRVLWGINGALEVNQSKQETMLVEMAQSISDSVASKISHNDGGAASVVSHSVQDVLTSHMTDLVAQLNASQKAVDERMAAIANVVSDAVRTTLGEWQASQESSAALAMGDITTSTSTSITNAHTTSHDATIEATQSVPPATAELRSVLVAAIQEEMGKTHEVNLTPMYQYVDSILAFLKEELANQNSSLTGQLEHIRGALANAEGPESATLTSLHRKVDQLLEGNIGQIDSQPLHQQLEAMEAAAKQRNQELLETIKSSATLDGPIGEQLRSIEAMVKGNSTNSDAPNVAVNGKLEELALAVSDQRALLDRIRDSQVQEEKKWHINNGEALSPEHKEQWRVLQEKRSSRVERISSLVRTIDRAPREQLTPLVANLTAEIANLHSLEQQEKALTELVVSPPARDGATVADPFAQLHQALARVSSELSSSQTSLTSDVLAAIQQLHGTLTAEQVQERLDAVSAMLMKAQASHLDTELVKQSSRIEVFIQDAMNRWQAATPAVVEPAVVASDARNHDEAASSMARPWLWVSTNALVVAITIMCCVYYICACALVALVPKQTTAPAAADSASSSLAVSPKKQRKPLALADDVM